MKTRIHIEENWTSPEGNPQGGVVSGNGFTISWQNGPLGTGPERKEPNGAFVEDIISAAMSRLEFYQLSRFASKYNQRAISYLESALSELNSRTTDRENRGVEGTHNK